MTAKLPRCYYGSGAARCKHQVKGGFQACAKCADPDRVSYGEDQYHRPSVSMCVGYTVRVSVDE